MNRWQIDVLHFMQYVKGLTIPQEPTLPEASVISLCDALIIEEIEELSIDMGTNNIVGIADDIVDSIYVLLYTANAYGIDIGPIWEEIQRTNLLKKGGAKDLTTGKQLKPAGWKPPVIEFVKMPEPILFDGDIPVSWIDADGNIWQCTE